MNKLLTIYSYLFQIFFNLPSADRKLFIAKVATCLNIFKWNLSKCIREDYG